MFIERKPGPKTTLTDNSNFNKAHVIIKTKINKQKLQTNKSNKKARKATTRKKPDTTNNRDRQTEQEANRKTDTAECNAAPCHKLPPLFLLHILQGHIQSNEHMN